ncbi:hypothetical protein BDW59DRAFT_162607 [Aspergillus cavernicola]|uniref:Nucleotidyltransferase-like protein n=1 Tax=Aspergillus cavernicola TaxID=176166 RepID=A0ABR4I963_9EURO
MSSQLLNPGVRATATEVAQVLDKAEVPNLLFGWTALALVGIDQGFPEIDFVIADDKIEFAVWVLADAGYRLCTESECQELKEDRYPDTQDPVLIAADNRYHPIAYAHYHLETSDYLLSLFKQSDTLPWLPDLKAGPPGKRNPDLSLSTEPQLPPARDWEKGHHGCGGPWTELYPVNILNRHAYIEAVILLLCKDIDSSSKAEKLWRCMLASLSEFRLPQQRDDRLVKPEFRNIWHRYTLQSSRDVTLLEWDTEVRKLRDQMLADSQRPGIIRWLKKQFKAEARVSLAFDRKKHHEAVGEWRPILGGIGGFEHRHTYTAKELQGLRSKVQPLPPPNKRS